MNTEMEKLINMVNNANYESCVEEIFDTPQRILKKNGARIGDVICHRYSFGGDNGLLEIMGCGIKDDDGTGDVMGYLTAKKCFEIIREYYESQRNLTLLILYKETYCAMNYFMKT